MADDGVRPGRDYFLVADDLDGRCRIAIDAKDEEDDDPADDEEQIAEDCQPGRNIRPVPAPVKPRDQDEGAKTHTGEEHDHFLRGPLFSRGPAAGPSREQRRIFFPKIKRDGQGRAEKNHQVNPGLPIANRARAQEKHQRHDQSQEKVS